MVSLQREDKIRELVKAMTTALEAHQHDCSAAEMFSASLTHTALMLRVAEDMGAPPRTLRNAVETLLLRLPSDSRSAN